ncbi:MAG: hydroxymethylglutaryl-CoA lyase [Synergistaceae bacterium]|jgi:hydroxymethylglutaryl-CoA lyase|nr:hydroxymethylglutaryl-CoA lyase [Synergistaceae bacterium]
MPSLDFSSLPKRAEVIEVCPRDGFQNVRTPIPTFAKIAMLDALAEAGFKTIEVTSFVSPKAVPQMADAAEVMADFKRKHGAVEAVALVPNVKGAEKASSAGADVLNFVLSASESHNRENTRRTVEESLSELAEVCRIGGDKKVRASVATAFYCPFEGEIAKEAVLKIVGRALSLGCESLSLADTIGTAHPAKVHDTLSAVRKEYPKAKIVLHLHDTQGMALANTLTALFLGYDAFDGAAGGLGGCPFAPGAAGNVATEDLVNFLERLGIETGVDLPKLLAVSRGIPDKLGIPLCSHLGGRLTEVKDTCRSGLRESGQGDRCGI